MTSRNQIANLKYTLTFVMAFVLCFASAIPVQAKENIPTLNGFIESVRDGNANALRGVYIQDVMTYPIIQQPMGYPGYVSTEDKVITQFNMAAEVGNVGLLAHNFLAGSTFTQLALGQEVNLVYGDGKIEYFVISHIYKFQALSPTSPTSKFKDIETGLTISAEELFRQVYRGERHVTFQTCIEANGVSSWGRLFVIAEPKQITAQTINFQDSYIAGKTIQRNVSNYR
jgi:hypothetical protein